jgi:RNA-binding protein 25
MWSQAQATRELAEIDAEPIESDSSENAQVNAKNSPPPAKLDRLGSESNDSMGADHHFEDDTSRLSMGSDTPNSPQQPPQLHQGPIISLNLNVNVKKKRLEVKDVFNMNDDENEDQNGPKKRKLVPLGE